MTTSWIGRHTSGHEFVGHVVALGVNFLSVNGEAQSTQKGRPVLYSTLKVGDKVVSPFTVSCGECRYAIIFALLTNHLPIIVPPGPAGKDSAPVARIRSYLAPLFWKEDKLSMCGCHTPAEPSSVWRTSSQTPPVDLVSRPWQIALSSSLRIFYPLGISLSSSSYSTQNCCRYWVGIRTPVRLSSMIIRLESWQLGQGTY